MLIGVAGLRWAAWILLTAVAIANLHRVRHPVVAVVAVVATGGVTIAAHAALRGPGWQRVMTPRFIALEVVVATSAIAADGWVRQGRISGQNLAGMWPLPAILVAAVAGGAAWGAIVGFVFSAARVVAVVVAGVPAGQVGRNAVAVGSTAVAWIVIGAVCGTIVRLLRQSQNQLAEAEVRERMARDLHDGVLQTLALIERRSPSPDIARLARDQERELRAYLFDDHRVTGELASQLREAAARLERAWPTVVVTVTVGDDVPTLSHDQLEAAAGATAEALTNAAKHGHADAGGGVRRSRRGVGRVVPERQGRRFGVRPGERGRGHGTGPQHPWAGRADRGHGHGGVGAGRRCGGPDADPTCQGAVMNTPTYRVVIADDHPTVRSGIRADLGPPFVVVGEAGDANVALSLIESERPELVVCDLNMPEGGGLRVVRECTARYGDAVRVVVFTVSEHERDLIDAVASGAYGYLTKSTPGPELHRQLLRAVQGDPPFAPELATLLLGEFRRVAQRSTGTNPLSDREREVLNLVARGYTYRQVGKELFIAEKTVENHVRNILAKLHLSRKAELVRWAADHGIR